MTTPGVAERRLRAFVCHASEDKELARQIATDLHAAGIDTFFDDWEIAAGQSLRIKIDEGLQDCTHFVVLLTEVSLSKPWVNAEIDAGFIRKVEGSSVFIPLRHQLDIQRLPPLLRALYSPELGDYHTDLRRLVDDIRGISRKPPVNAVRYAPPAWGRTLALSPLAAQVAETFAGRSKNGRLNDPQLSVQTILETTGVSAEDLIDAISELEELGWVQPRRVVGARPFGYQIVTPTDLLFMHVDPHVMGWDASQDALRVAAELVNQPNHGLQSREIVTRLGWTPRRLNPALSYLILYGLVVKNENIDREFVTPSILKNDKTRRFVRNAG